MLRQNASKEDLRAAMLALARTPRRGTNHATKLMAETTKGQREDWRSSG